MRTLKKKISNVVLVNDGHIVRVYHGEEPIGTINKSSLQSLLDEEQDIQRIESFNMYEPKPLQEVEEE
jgi:hypothetical protein